MVAEPMPGNSRNRKPAGAQLVVDALVRVLVRDGLDGLSVRRVAAEASVSIGAVQHHFPTKDALLIAAADHVTAQFKARAERLVCAALTEGGRPAAFLAFCQLLANAAEPAEAAGDDTAASVIWLWYAAKATQPGVVAQAFTTGWSQTESYLRSQIAEFYPHLDAAAEAGHLLAVLDGLAIARAAEPYRMPCSRAATIVQHHLTHLATRNERSERPCTTHEEATADAPQTEP